MLVIGLSTGVVHADLVGHWKFDEGTDTVAYDSSIYGNNGIFKGDPQWVVGHFSGALEFDGTGDWLDCGTHPSLEITGAVSMTAWIKVGTKDIDHKLGSNQDEANGGYKMAVFNNRIEFEIRTSDKAEVLNRDVAGGTEIEVGVWYHVAGVYSLEDGYIRTYVNGVLDRELLTSQVLGASTESFKIGCEPFATGMYNFNGVIDDLRIYNHAIDEDEIQQLCDRGGASFIPTGYVAKLTEETENIVKELKPKEAVVFIEKKIADYERWRIRNLGHIKSRDIRLSSDIYVLLARVKEAAGAPTRDVIATYKQSVSQPQKPSNYIPAALLWLFEKTPTEEYIKIVRECVRNSENPSRNIYDVAKYYESRENWTAFKLFLDATFSEVNDTTSFAMIVANSLEKDGVWTNMFLEYCRNKPELTGYIFRESEKNARNYLIKKNFVKALEIYRDIVSRCGPNQNKASYEFKIYECIFNDGHYDSVVKNIDNFIKNNKNTHKLLISKAIILKGQAYVKLGDIDRATDTFFTLMIEYPEVKEAPEANFFVGYCYMLQGKFDEATEAFNLVVKDYPKSGYVNKTRSYLMRIKNMTE